MKIGVNVEERMVQHFLRGRKRNRWIYLKLQTLGRRPSQAQTEEDQTSAHLEMAFALLSSQFLIRALAFYNLSLFSSWKLPAPFSSFLPLPPMPVVLLLTGVAAWLYPFLPIQEQHIVCVMIPLDLVSGATMRDPLHRDVLM
jgi:hypothetical protein